jgi:hypothetical protein
MRTYDSASLAALAAGNVKPRYLLWIEAKNRSTGETETVGLWNGDQDQSITIGGVARTYLAGGSLLDVGVLDYRAGQEIVMRTIRLSPINEAVEQVIRGYEPRLAPVQLHEVVYDLATDRITGTPQLRFDGQVDSIRLSRASAGGESGVDLVCASRSREGTRYGTGLKTQAHLGALYRYSAVKGQIEQW